MPRGDRFLPGFLIAGVSFYALTTLLNGETPDEPANTVATAEATVAPARGSLGSYDLRPRKAVQIKLPNRLREISGLAVTDDGRLSKSLFCCAIIFISFFFIYES